MRLTYFKDGVTLKAYICMKCGCPTFCAEDYKDHKENMCIGWLKEKIIEAKQNVEEHKKKEAEIEKCSESWVRIEPTKAQTFPGAPPYSFEQEEEAAGVEPEEKRVRYTFKPSWQKGVAQKKGPMKCFVTTDADHEKRIKEMQEVLNNLENLSKEEKSEIIETFNTEVQGMLADVYAQQVPGVPAPDVICLLEEPDQPTRPEQPEIAASTSTGAAAAAAPTLMDMEPGQPPDLKWTRN